MSVAVVVAAAAAVVAVVILLGAEVAYFLREGAFDAAYLPHDTDGG